MALETKGNTQIAGVNSTTPAQPKDSLVDTVNQLARLNIKRDTSRLTSGREMSGSTYQYNRDTAYHDAAKQAGIKLDPLMQHQWDGILKDTQSKGEVFSRAVSGFFAGATAGALDSLGSNDPHEIAKLGLGISDEDGYGNKNFLMRWADQIQDYSARHNHIFTTEEDDSIFDATYWANQAQTLGYTAGIALETIGEQALLSLLTGATGGSTAAIQAGSAVRSSTKLGKALSLLSKGGKNIAKFLSKPSAFGVYSGLKETYLNSLEVQDQVFQEFKQRGYSDEEALKYAAEAASENMRLEFGPVAALNAMQFGLLGRLGKAKVNPFNVTSKARFSFGTSDFVSGIVDKVLPINKIGNKYLSKAANLGVQAFAESIEEGWQEGTSMYLKEKKLREKDEFTGLTMNEAIFSSHLEDAMIAGAFGGAVMSVGHKALKKTIDFFNRDAIAREAKEKQDTLNDIKTSFQRMNENLNNATELSNEDKTRLRSNINFNNVAQALQFDYRHQTTDGFDSYMAMLEQAENAINNGKNEVLTDLGLDGYAVEDIQRLRESAIQAKEIFTEEYHNTDDDFSIAFAQMKRRSGIENLTHSAENIKSRLEELKAKYGYEGLSNEEKSAYKTLQELTSLLDSSRRDKVLEYINKPEIQEAIGNLIETENLRRVEAGMPELTQEEQKSVRDKYIMGNITDNDLELSDELKTKIKELSDTYDNLIEEKGVSNSKIQELLGSNIIENQKLLDNTNKSLENLKQDYNKFRDKKHQRKWREEQIQKQREEYEKQIAEINANPNLSKKEKREAIRKVLGQKESLIHKIRNWVYNIRKKDDPVKSTNDESARRQQEQSPTPEQKKQQIRQQRASSKNNVSINDILEMQKSHKIERDSEFYYITIPESDTPIKYNRVHSILPPQYSKKSISFEEVLSEIEDSNYDPEVINKWLNSERVNTITQQDSYTEEERDTAIEAIRANMQHYITMGNTVDSIVRDIFQDKTPQKPEGTSQEVFDNIVNEANKLKESLKSQGLRGITESVVLWHTFPDGTKVAGEVDMLIVDANNNVVGILDIKTSKWGYNNERFTSTKGGKFISTKDYYTYQLSTYADLLEGQYGTVVNDLRLAVFKLEGESGNITSVEGVTLSENIPYKHNPNLPEIQQEGLLPEEQEVIDIINSEDSNAEVEDLHIDEYISHLQKITPFPSEFNSVVKSVVISAVNTYGNSIKNYIRVTVNNEGVPVVHVSYSAYTGEDAQGNYFTERVLLHNTDNSSVFTPQIIYLNNPSMPGTFNTKTVPVIRDMLEVAEDAFIDNSIQDIEVETAHQEIVDNTLEDLISPSREVQQFRSKLAVDETIISNEDFNHFITKFLLNNTSISVDNFDYKVDELAAVLKSPESYIDENGNPLEEVKITFDGGKLNVEVHYKDADGFTVHKVLDSLESIKLSRNKNKFTDISTQGSENIFESVNDIFSNPSRIYYSNPNLVTFENVLVDPSIANSTYDFLNTLIEDFKQHRTDPFTWVNLFKHLNSINKELFNQFRRKDKFGMLMSHYKYALHINGLDTSSLTNSTINEIYNAVYYGETREHIKNTGMSVSSSLNKLINEAIGNTSIPSTDISAGSAIPTQLVRGNRVVTKSHIRENNATNAVIVFGASSASTHISEEVQRLLVDKNIPVNTELYIQTVDISNIDNIPESLREYVTIRMPKMLEEGSNLEDITPIIFTNKDGDFIGVMPNAYPNTPNYNNIRSQRATIIKHFESNDTSIKVTITSKDNGSYHTYSGSTLSDFSTLKSVKDILDMYPDMNIEIGYLSTQRGSLVSLFNSDNRSITTEDASFVFDYPVGNLPSGKPAIFLIAPNGERKILELQTSPLTSEDIDIILKLIYDAYSNPKSAEYLAFNISKFIRVPQRNTNSDQDLYQEGKTVYFKGTPITEIVNNVDLINEVIEHLRGRKFYFDHTKYSSRHTTPVEMPTIKNGRVYTHNTGVSYRDFVLSRIGTNVVVRPYNDGTSIKPSIYPNPVFRVSNIKIEGSVVNTNNLGSLNPETELQIKKQQEGDQQGVIINALQPSLNSTITTDGSPFTLVNGFTLEDLSSEIESTIQNDSTTNTETINEFPVPPVSTKKRGEKGIKSTRDSAIKEIQEVLSKYQDKLSTTELEHINSLFQTNVNSIKENNNVKAYTIFVKNYVETLASEHDSRNTEESNIDNTAGTSPTSSINIPQTSEVTNLQTLSDINTIMSSLLSKINMSWGFNKNTLENTMMLLKSIEESTNYLDTTIPYNFFVEFEKLGFDRINAYVENEGGKSTSLDILKKELLEHINNFKKGSLQAIEAIQQIAPKDVADNIKQVLTTLHIKLELSITDENNWRALVEAIQFRLNSITNGRYDIVENKEEEFEDEYGFDESEEHHSKFSLSKEVRQFLSGIPKKVRNSEGVLVTMQGFLGMNVYMDYSEVFNIVQSILTYPSPVKSDYNYIKNRLEENIGRYPFLVDVISKIEKAPEGIRNQFVYSMTQVHNIPIKAHMGSIIYANSREAYIRISKEITSEAKELLTNSEGSVNVETIREFLSEYESLINTLKDNGTLEENWLFSEKLSSLMHTIGIYINPETILTIFDGKKGLKLSRHTDAVVLNGKKAFTESTSPFMNIKRGLASLGTNSITVDSFIRTYLSGISVFPIINLMVSQDEGSYSKTYRDGGKVISSVVSPRYANDAVNLLQENTYRESISGDVLTTNNLWLQVLSIDNVKSLMEFNVFSVSANSSALGRYTELSTSERNEIDYNLYKDAIQVDSLKNLTSDTLYEGLPLILRRMPFPAMADKSQMFTYRVPTLDLSNWTVEQLTAQDSSQLRILLNFLVDSIVTPELLRIEKYVSNPSLYNIDGHSKTFGIFHQVPALNAFSITTERGSVNILDAVHSIQRNGGTKISTYINDDPNVKYELGVFLLKNILGVNDINVSTIAELTNIEITSRLPRNITQEELYPLFGLERKLNYVLTNVFLHSSIVGDAAYYVRDKDIRDKSVFTEEGTIRPEALLNIEDTISKLNKLIIINGGTNLGKRMAILTAQGHKIANSNNDHYVQLFLEDYYKSSTSMLLHMNAVYPEVMGDKAQRKKITKHIDSLTSNDESKIAEAKKFFYTNYPIVAPYLDNNATDAQEYTTAKEHIDILFRQGKLSKTLYDRIVDKLSSYNNKELNGETILESDLLTREEISKIMQPIKPVYTGTVYDVPSDSLRPMYIKSSSFPLIPQLTKGLELDKMRRFMEEVQSKTGRNVRASYQSANKVGAINNPIKVWNSDNTFNEELFELLENVDSFTTSHAYILPRTNFKIQLEVPYKDKETIAIGTQIQKLLFGDGVIDIEGILHKGKRYSGKKLQEEYLKVFSDIIANRRRRLNIQLGIDSNGNITNPEKAFNKLRNILIREAQKKGWTPGEIQLISNSMSGNYFQKGKSLFNIPLFMLPNANSIETLLMSFINNELFSLKMPGYSFVAASEAGYKVTDSSNLSENILSKIVYTKHFNGSLKAAEFHIGKDGKIDGLKSAQVLLPSKFRDNKGNLIEFIHGDGTINEDYVERDPETGTLRVKEGMIDNEILTSVSFRTPTSSHISTASITIAGFLPPEAGDIIVLPSNFTTQKGLDFDVDKENLYSLFTYVDPTTKQIRSYKASSEVKLTETVSKTKPVKLFEVSAEGDELGKKFSTLNANIKAESDGYITLNNGIRVFLGEGKEATIEQIYQNIKLVPYTEENGVITIDLSNLKPSKERKGKAPLPGSILRVLDEEGKEKDNVSKEEGEDFSYNKIYLPLWEYFIEHTEDTKAVEDLADKVLTEGYTLNDVFGKNTSVTQARALTEIIHRDYSTLKDIKDWETFSEENASVYDPYFYTSTPPSKHVNISGGTEGADLMFYKHSLDSGVEIQEQYLFNNTQKDTRNKVAGQHIKQITEISDVESAVKLYKEVTGRDLDTSSQMYSGMLRNMHVALQADAIYAVAPLESEISVYGGTNYAVRAAIKLRKPVFVYNGEFEDKVTKDGKKVIRTNTFQKENTGKWMYFDYDTNTFKPYNGVPPLYPKFAGIGSRQANTPSNNSAIKELFEVNFNGTNTLSRNVYIKDNVELEEESVSLSRIEQLEKTLSNEFVRITKSVLSSPILEIQAKMNKTLNMDFARNQAEELSNTNYSFTTLGDRDYQHHKITLGAVGKFGIGVYSSAVTLSSLIQQAYAQDSDSTRMIVTNKADNEEVEVKFSFNINGQKFDSTTDSLGKDIKTKYGDRSIAEVLAERQNTATDNDKEQIMGRLNVNEFTIGVDVMLTLLGFDKFKHNEDGKEYSIPYVILRSPYVQYASDLVNKYGYDTEYILGNLYDSILNNYNLDSSGTLLDITSSIVGKKKANISMDMSIVVNAIKSNKSIEELSEDEQVECLKAAGIFILANLMNKNILKFQRYTNIQKNKLGMTFDDGDLQFKRMETLSNSDNPFYNNFLAKKAMSNLFLDVSRDPFNYLKTQFLSDVNTRISSKKGNYVYNYLPEEIKDYIVSLSTLNKASDKFHFDFSGMVSEDNKSIARLLKRLKSSRSVPYYIKDNMFFKRLIIDSKKPFRLLINFDNSDASEKALLLSEASRLYSDNNTVLIEDFYGKPLTPKMFIDLIGYTTFVGDTDHIFGNLHSLLPVPLIQEIYEGIDDNFIRQVLSTATTEKIDLLARRKVKSVVTTNRFRDISILEALNIYNPNNNPPYRKLLEEAIRSIEEDINVSAIYSDVSNGVFYPKYNSINLDDSGDDSKSSTILLHEAVHAMTVDYINSNNSSIEVLKLGAIVSELKNISEEDFIKMFLKHNPEWNRYDNDILRSKITPMFDKLKAMRQNVEELVAHVASDVEAMRILNMIDAIGNISNKGIIATILEFLRKLLSASNINIRENSVLEQVLPRAWYMIGNGTNLFKTYSTDINSMNNLQEALLSPNTPSSLVRIATLYRSNPNMKLRVKIPNTLSVEEAKYIFHDVLDVKAFYPEFTHDSDNTNLELDELYLHLNPLQINKLKDKLGESIMSNLNVRITKQEYKCQ